MPAPTNMREAVVAALTADSTLATLLGRRVYWITRPQGDPLPAITCHTIADTDGATHSGRSAPSKARVQFTCWGNSFTDADAVARAVKTLLSAYKANLGGYVLGPCFFITRVDFREGLENVFQAMVDFYVWNPD